MDKQKDPEIKKVEEKFQATDKKKISQVVLKVVGANVVNLVLLAASFYILNNLNGVAEKIKELRSAQISSQETSDISILKADLEKNQDKVNELRSFYVDDDGFADFLSEMNRIKGEGIITEFSFPGSDPITTGKQKGYPVLLVFQGSRDAVNSSLSSVLALPFLLSPQNVEVETTGEAITLRFGAILLTR